MLGFGGGAWSLGVEHTSHRNGHVNLHTYIGITLGLKKKFNNMVPYKCCSLPGSRQSAHLQVLNPEALATIIP